MARGPARFCQSWFWSYDLSLPTWSTGLMPAESFYWYFIDTYWPDAAHSVCACFSCLHMHRLSSLAWWAVPLAPAKSIVWISGLANHGPTRQGSWKALHGATFTKKDGRIFVQFASPKDDELRHIQDIQDIMAYCRSLGEWWIEVNLFCLLEMLIHHKCSQDVSIWWRLWWNHTWLVLSQVTQDNQVVCGIELCVVEEEPAVPCSHERRIVLGIEENWKTVMLSSLTNWLSQLPSPVYENIPKLSTPPPVLQLLLLFLPYKV